MSHDPSSHSRTFRGVAWLCFFAVCTTTHTACDVGERVNVIELTSQEALTNFVDAINAGETGLGGDVIILSGGVNDLSVFQRLQKQISARWIIDNTELREIDHLEHIYGLEISIQNNTKLERIVFAQPEAHTLRVLDNLNDNGISFTLEIPIYTYLAGDFEVHNSSVASISAPVLEYADQFSITDNPNLCTLNLPVLEEFTKGDGVQNNPCLPPEQVDAINALREEPAPTPVSNRPAPQPETPAPEGE